MNPLGDVTSSVDIDSYSLSMCDFSGIDFMEFKAKRKYMAM